MPHFLAGRVNRSWAGCIELSIRKSAHQSKCFHTGWTLLRHSMADPLMTGVGRNRPDRFRGSKRIHLDARQSLHLTQMFEAGFVSPEILMCSRPIERRDIGIPEDKIERTDFGREITRDLSTPEKEFLTCKRRSRATVRSFAENCSKSMLKVTQAPTECRLPDAESLCCPPKAFVLSCDNNPAQRSKFNAHRVFHVSMRSWPLADKFVFRGVGNQPWQP